MFQFDGGMTWGQKLATSKRSCGSAGAEGAGNDQPSLLVPVQSVSPALVGDGQRSTAPVPIGPSRTVDSEETRLSSSDEELRQEDSVSREVTTCSAQELGVEGEIRISSNITEEEDKVERQRIVSSHDRARRAIISAVLPEDAKLLRAPLRQAVSVNSKVQLSSTSENEDFSFLRPLSLEFHM